MELLNHLIFKNLTPDEVNQLKELITIREYKCGDIVEKEDATTNCLYSIMEGEVEVLKWNEDHTQQHHLDTLRKNDYFGEIAFVSEETRSSTIKCLTPCKLCVLDKPALESHPTLLKSISLNILNNNNLRLKETNNKTVGALESHIHHLKQLSRFGQFFIYMLIAFAIGNSLDGAVKNYQIDIRSVWFNWSYLLLLVLPMFLIARACKLTCKEMGVTYHKWLRSTIEGLIVAIPLGLLFYFVASELVEHVDVRTFHIPLTTFGIGSYVIHSYVQEWLARGILQTTLMKFYDEQHGIKAVLITSVIFALPHLHIGFAIAGFTFIGSAILGFVYLRTRNLIGVTIIHATLGIVAKITGIL